MRRPADTGGQKHQVGLVGMNDDRVGIVGLLRHRVLAPGLAIVVAGHDADDTVGDQDTVRPGRIDQYPMNVIFTDQRVDVKVLKRLAEVGRDEQGADFDADHQAVAIEHDVLDVADARRWRKAPAGRAVDIAQRRQLAPTVAIVLADIEMRRQ